MERTEAPGVCLALAKSQFHHLLEVNCLLLCKVRATRSTSQSGSPAQCSHVLLLFSSSLPHSTFLSSQPESGHQDSLRHSAPIT